MPAVKSKKDMKKVGRPEGTRNPTPLERILRDEVAIIEACRKKALTGDAACAEFCLTLIGKFPPLLIRPDPKPPQQLSLFRP